ncbi:MULTISPECIES: hypothetical protein [Saccharothrix]|uniref:hypothetical protein n=1 Tax=Saccharothrix TaxID=2071 RepID=UPI00093FDE5E|nr:hypothetical protein [Saccharothrix sp. CB00851]OKI39246.1 hypothetical protein A6A25_03545 [Saccharothrix sp. CB00851]
MDWFRRRKKAWDAELYSSLLAYYCELMERELGQRCRVVAWFEEARLRENGDVDQRFCVTIVAECDRLDFVTFHDRVNWDWPEKHRDRVKVEVRTPEKNGIGGTRLDTTHRWIRKGQIKAFIHLDRPISRGEEFTFVIDMFWPQKCLPFARGAGPDSFLVSFGEIAHTVECRVVLPKRWAANFEHLGLEPGQDDYVVTGFVNREGHLVASLTVRNLPGYRKVGLKLDMPSLPA